MFEAKSIALPQLVEAAYYAMLALERRFGPEDLEREPILEGLASEPGPEERELAHRWIEEIEQQENRSIHDLDSETIQRYVGELSDTVQHRVKAEVKPDPVRGEQLLEKLSAQVFSS